MSFLKMAIRRVSTIRLEERKHTAFLQAAPCKAPDALLNTLWGQPGSGIGLDWVLSLGCHWGVSSPGSVVSRPAASTASPGELFKMQILSPYPGLTESETLISSLFQQALRVVLCMRARMEKALLWATAGGPGRLLLPVHSSKGHVSPSELQTTLVIDRSVSFKIHRLGSNPQDLRTRLYLETGSLTR